MAEEPKNEKPANPLPLATKLAYHWATYAQQVVPAEASTGQYVETKRAFLAGAIVVFGMLEKIGEPDVPEAMGIEWLESLKQELDAWVAQLRRASLHVPNRTITLH